MNKRISLLLPLLLTTPFRASPQNQSTQSLGASVDKYMAPLIGLNVFSGTILIARGQSILLERSYGYASIEQQVPMPAASMFRIASISKSFTKALVGRLAEKGLLSFDDPLSRWLPECEIAKGMTLRMVIDHRAGVPSVNSLPYDEEAIEQNNLAKLVAAICKMSPDFAPGTKQRYSNGGYALLARVIEVAGKGEYGALLQREVIEPLGLHHTFHESEGMVVRDLALGYMPDPAVKDRMVRPPFQEMTTKTGGGSLVSNSHDLLVWARAIGRSTILKPQTWATLFPETDSLFSFGGRCPGYNSFLLHDRKNDLTIVVLANNYAAGMTSDIASAGYAIVRGLTPAALSVSQPSTADGATARLIAGRYALPPGAFGLPPGTTVELRVSGSDLVAYIGSTPVDVLVPQGPRRFLARALWSMIEIRGPDPAPDSIEVRALFRDFTFTAPRVNSDERPK